MNLLEIVLRCPSDLTIHPSARDLPELADDDPQFIALCDDVRENGITTPIDIDKHNQVIDGRHRLRISRKLKLDSIPAVIRDENTAIGIILGSILLRRHYSKGALAYTAYPLFKELYDEALKSRHSFPSIFDAIAIARRFGVSDRLMRQAQELHKIFAQAPEYQELILPQILAGETSIGAAIAGYAGARATKGKVKKVNQLQLFSRTWVDLRNRFTYWGKFDHDQKREASKGLKEVITAMPRDLLVDFHRRASAELKQRKEEER